MLYAELVFFEGAHFAHIAAWEEYKRLAYKRDRVLRYLGKK